MLSSPITRRFDVQLYDCDSASVFELIRGADQRPLTSAPRLSFELCQRLFQIDLDNQREITLLKSTLLHRSVCINASCIVFKKSDLCT
jgi:hypothetical protein